MVLVMNLRYFKTEYMRDPIRIFTDFVVWVKNSLEELMALSGQLSVHDVTYGTPQMLAILCR